MSKLKEHFPLVGRTVDYYGEDLQIVNVSQRRGRMVYVGRVPGTDKTYFMDPTKVQISNPSF